MANIIPRNLASRSTSALGLTAGEVIAAGNAICIDYNSGTSSYFIYKADSSISTRKNSLIGFATMPAAIGQSVSYVEAGVAYGFSGLTVGAAYFLGTAGAITKTPTGGSPFQIGIAITTTALFVNINTAVIATTGTFVRSHGSSAAASAAGVSANATQDVEHFNFTSWSAGTSSALGVRNTVSAGDAAYNGAHYQLDGTDSSNTVLLSFQSYNKTAWSTLTNRTNARKEGGSSAFNGFYYGVGGFNGTAQSDITKWNGSSWATPGATLASIAMDPGAFVQNSILRVVGGWNGSSNITTHTTITTADSVSTSTAVPTAEGYSGASSAGGNGYVGATRDSGGGTTATVSYQWNGSWSSSITITAAAQAGIAFSNNNQLTTWNGGCTAPTTVTNNSFNFNGTAVGSSVASSNSRTSGCASVI